MRGPQGPSRSEPGNAREKPVQMCPASRISAEPPGRRRKSQWPDRKRGVARMKRAGCSPPPCGEVAEGCGSRPKRVGQPDAARCLDLPTRPDCVRPPSPQGGRERAPRPVVRTPPGLPPPLTRRRQPTYPQGGGEAQSQPATKKAAEAAFSIRRAAAISRGAGAEARGSSCRPRPQAFRASTAWPWRPSWRRASSPPCAWAPALPDLPSSASPADCRPARRA